MFEYGLRSMLSCRRCNSCVNFSAPIMKKTILVMTLQRPPYRIKMLQIFWTLWMLIISGVVCENFSRFIDIYWKSDVRSFYVWHLLIWDAAHMRWQLLQLVSDDIPMKSKNCSKSEFEFICRKSKSASFWHKWVVVLHSSCFSFIPYIST